MKTSSDSSAKPASQVDESKSNPKPTLTTRAPMTAREANLSSVFDACIPGNMLMYPINQQNASSKGEART